MNKTNPSSTSKVRLSERIVCPYCFEVLDPDSKDEKRRSFVRCDSCGALYHRVCSETLQHCINRLSNHAVCNATNFHSVQVSQPPRLSHRLSVRPILFKGVRSIYREDIGTKQTNITQAIISFGASVLLSVRIFIVLIIFLLLITFVSAYAFQIISLTDPTFQTVLDAILRAPLPPSTVFFSAGLATLIGIYVFYPKVLPNGEGNPSPGRRMIRFLAAIVILVLYNIALLDWSIQELNTPKTWLLDTEQELLIAQGVALVGIFLLTPLYRVLVSPPSIHIEQLPTFIQSIIKGVGVIRFYVIGFGTVLCAVIFTINVLLPHFREMGMNRDWISSTTPVIIAFAFCAAISMAFYWPPTHSPAAGNFLLLRMLGVLICAVLLGLLYNSTTNPTAYIHTLGLSGVIGICLTPVQRALS